MSGPRIVVAGLGSMGRRRLSALLDLGVEEIVLLRSEAGEDGEPPTAAPGLPVVDTIEAALGAFAGGPPDAVFLCVPATHRLALALPAARAGCHLFLEKPVAASTDGVADLVAEAERRRLVTMVGFDLRFEPGLLRVRELLDRGTVGPVRSLRAHVGQYLPDWRPGRDYRETITAREGLGGGVLLELCHEIDLALWLGGPVAAVTCRATRVGPLEMDAENLAELVLDLESGAVASVHLDCLDRAPTRTLRILGDEGTIVWYYHAKSVAWCVGGTCGSGPEWKRFEYSDHHREDRFRHEVEVFLGAVRTGGAGELRPPVDVRAGAAVLDVVAAAKESACRNAAVRLGGRVTPSASDLTRRELGAGGAGGRP